MKWSRSRALLTGAALILATNIVVLGGVAYNRSGEPESTLKLTQRELALPYAWGLTKENSGLALHIAWRVVEQESERPGTYMASYYGDGAAPYWLNEAKLIALGVDVSRLRRTADDKPRRELLPSKEVFLALELDGPEYQKLLEQVRRYTAAAQNRLRGSPGDKELEQRAKVATEALKQEERENSRLVVVDAGLERDALRTTYPDRTRYAIVRGRVQPQSGPKPTYTPRGRIVRLSVTDLNVPASLRNEVGDARPLRTLDTENTPPPYNVTVSYGRRLEPWIAAASKPTRSE
jgi:Domain of unknown function (DUF4824)